ncbi:transketolase [Candidatus Peregrinibacteria bacterium HGW-Peregrinibacteria-1]|jgi:transketolase|nr:MAG: transketolase [Candidatus Peregrinibacteria bacterium HGW-Peregrinibacteria-1]
MDNGFLEKKAAQLRLDCLTSIYNSQVGHVGSCMSVVEILVALYYGTVLNRPVVNVDPNVPGWDFQDYVIFSKGQASPIWYAVLADLGFFAKDELGAVGKKGSLLTVKPNIKIPGVNLPSTSPGNSLSAAVGLALSLKMERKNNRVYVVLGDGELQTGEVWEAAMAAAHFKLNNLVVVIDHNKIQGDGKLTSVLDVGSIQSKFDAFGWHVYQALSGHDFDDLLNSFMRSFNSNRKPTCIWANTVSGKGVAFAEGKEEYRHAGLSRGEAQEVFAKLHGNV